MDVKPPPQNARVGVKARGLLDALVTEFFAA
jgi:hypothetical protein